MSDPDLYNWKEPAKRFAAEQRRDAAKKNDSFFTPSSSNKASTSTSSSGNITPEEAAGAVMLAGAAAAAVVVAAGAVVYGVSKVTYEGIRRTLNKRDGLEVDSDQNNVKAGLLTAGAFAAVAAIGVAANEYNEKRSKILNAQFPSIAVAFNKGNRSFISTHVSYEAAEKTAISECKRKSANPFSCEVKGKVEAGKPMCIDYGAAVKMRRYMSNNMPNFKIVGAEYFINFTDDKSQPNLASNTCLKKGRYNEHDCTVSYKRTCNF